jgi:hypothetical protein
MRKKPKQNPHSGVVMTHLLTSLTFASLFGVMLLGTPSSADSVRSTPQQERNSKLTTPSEPNSLKFPNQTNFESQLVRETALLADGHIAFGNNKIIATVKLDNRSILRFVKFESGKIAVLEEAPKGAESISTVSELQNGTALADVFYAFSEPGTVVPQELLAVSQLTTKKKPQGWARPLITTPMIVSQLVTGNCNDATFRSWFDQYTYNDRGTPDVRLNQVPQTSSYFNQYNYAPGNGQSYRFYRYAVGENIGSIWYDVDRYVSRVAVCNIDQTESANIGGLAHPPISYQGYSNPHMGPVVTMSYRLPNETTWHTATTKDFAANEVGTTLSWHFFTGSNWDWKTTIDWAGGDDSFDIGHAVEDL